MHFFLQFLLNPWILAINVGVLALFGMKAYDIYAKTWLASSGKYSTEARITYTEFRDNSQYTRMLGNLPNEGMICYAYRVDGHLYTGTLPPDNLSQSYVDQHLKPGSKITVYFSPKAPQHAFPNEPPSAKALMRHATATWLFTPLVLINVAGYFIWYLFQ